MPREANTSEEGLDALGPARTINDRYRVVRYLGRGGMGDVCLVHDNLKGGTPLALKRVRKDRIDSRSVAILRNEFLALASLPHPNLARVFDFGVDRETGDVFFTVEFVDGVNWLQATRGLDLGQSLGLESLFGMLAQVLRGLEFIHCRGIVHGDIKPENLLVVLQGDGTGDAPGGSRLKIIDFGLAREERVLVGEKVLGTPYYVAPETILGSKIDRRTDLYSLGVVLYYIATGRPPFLGESNLVILKGHIEKKPVPPQELVPSLPPQLGDLILRLMEKRPDDRFQGALEVIEHINRAFGFSIPLETLETLRSYPAVAALVGRETERGKLRSIFLSASGMDPSCLETTEDPVSRGERMDGPADLSVLRSDMPRGRMAILLGEKGVGKRRLADDLCHLGQALEARFLRVDCGGRDVDEAGGLESLLAELARFDWPEWKNGLPAHIQSSLVLAGARSSSRTEAEEERSGIQEVAKALFESSQDQPTVIHFQDLHRAGKAVLSLVRVLVEFASTDRVPHQRLLVTATAEDRCDRESSDFRALLDDPVFRGSVVTLFVPRLSEVQANRLLRAAFPGSRFPETFARRIAEESDGNLEVIFNILYHLLEKQKITRRISGWELEGDYEEEDFPGKVRGEIRERLARLPTDILRLAMAFACLGENGDADLATALSDIPVRSAGTCLSVLRRERILDPIQDGSHRNLYGFVHSGVRSILYHMIPPGQLEALHERAGNIIEERTAATGSRSVRELAYHYLRAGNRKKGIPLGLEAARELARNASVSDALQVYEQVLALLGTSEERLAASVTREVASLRLQVGDYQGVITMLGTGVPSGASRETGRGDPMALVDGARAHARLGRFPEAASILQDAALLEETKRSKANDAVVLLAMAELHAWRGDVMESLRHSKLALERQAALPDVDLRCRLHLLMADSLFRLGYRDEAAGHAQSAMRLIDSQRDNRALARSLLCRGKYYLYRDQHSKALRQLQLCAVLCDRTGAREEHAECRLAEGQLLCALGRPHEARPILEAVLAFFEESGNFSQSVSAGCILAEASRLCGDPDRCRQLLKVAIQRSAALAGDRVKMEALLTFAGHSLDAGDLASVERYLSQARRHCARIEGTGHGLLMARWLELEAGRQAGDFTAALAAASTGLLEARLARDVLFQGRFLESRASLYCILGRRWEARRSLVALLDLSRRHGLLLAEGHARRIEAAILAREGREDAASRLYAASRVLVTRHGGERDRAALQLEQALLFLVQGQHEQAFLNLEEGLHVATRLQLEHLGCQFRLAMSRLEALSGDEKEGRALERLKEAEEIARAHGYRELLWRAQWRLGRLLDGVGRHEEAETYLAAAGESLRTLLDALPLEYRGTYLSALCFTDRDPSLAAHEPFARA